MTSFASIALMAATIAVAVLGLRAAVRKLVRGVTVHEYEAGLLYRSGRFVRRVGTGAYLVFIGAEELVVVDTRRRVVTVPGQEVLSADGVGLKVSLAVACEIGDPVRALHGAQSYEETLRVAVQLALRAEVAAAKIEEILQQRTELAARLVATVAPQAEAIGLRVHSVDVKDVMLPGELKKLFAEGVRAQKEGQAALERARGETAALRSMANAARLVAASPALMSLRVLQTADAAASRGGTVVMGLSPGLVPMGGRSGGRGGSEG